VSLGIHGDAGSFCTKALEILERKPMRFFTGTWIRTLQEDLPRIQATHKPFLEDDRPACHPLRLCAEVDRFLGDEGILISDGGDTQAWMPMIRRFNQEGGYMDTGLFGCLGVGIPFGIAAKALRPGETVVVFNGDGSMGFNMMEFDTAVRHRLPIIIVVNNDLAWGMIKHGNELTFGRDNRQGSELGLVRYDRIAEAMGGYGELVRDPAGISGALQRARSQDVPSCINVLTDTTAVSPGTVGLTMLFAQSLQDFQKA
jgi:acetolactate synthase-1/2/3 large subunit